MILPLEHQVAPLKESIRLRELGMPQETYFWWVEFRNILLNDSNKIFKMLVDFEECLKTEQSNYIKDFHKYAAPNVAELGWLLREDWANNRFAGDCWVYSYGYGDNDQIKANTQAEAMALRLIYLVEKGDIKF